MTRTGVSLLLAAAVAVLPSASCVVIPRRLVISAPGYLLAASVDDRGLPAELRKYTALAPLGPSSSIGAEKLVCAGGGFEACLKRVAATLSHDIEEGGTPYHARTSAPTPSVTHGHPHAPAHDIEEGGRRHAIPRARERTHTLK